MGVKNKLATALVTGCIAAMVVGCSDSSGGDSDVLSVIFPFHEADNTGFWPTKVRAFQQKYGVTVKLKQGDWQEIADLVVPAVEGGSDEYDVIEFDNGWVADFSANDYLEPLDNWMPEGFSDDMIPGQKSLFGWGGKLYGVVWNNDVRFFLYNKAILADAGIAAPPKTLDELKSQCATIKARATATGAAYFCTVLSLVGPWETANDAHFWTYASGGNFIDANHNIIWNKADGGAVEGLTYVSNLIKEGYVDPQSFNLDQTQQAQQFLDGKAAFLMQAFPSVYASAQDSGHSTIVGQAAIGLVPGKTENQTATLSLPEAFAIPKNSKRKELAWKFIEFTTDKEANKELTLQDGAIPIYKSLYSDPAILGQYAYFSEFTAQLDSAQGLTNVTWYSDLADKLGTAVKAALKDSPGDAAAVQQALDSVATDLKANNGKP